MDVQILGLREFTNAEGKTVKTETFFNRGWRAPSVAKLFVDMEHYVGMIPDAERFNLYYTASNCLEERGRKIVSQDVIPFDVDGIVGGTEEQVAEVVCKVLDVSPDDCGIVFSGNGIQVIVGSSEVIEDEEYFEDNRKYYKAICADIDWQLGLAGLDGEADSSVWSPARLLRLPMTKNIKPDKGTKEARLWKRAINAKVDLKKLSRLPLVDESEQVSDNLLNRISVDPVGVQQGCDFLKWCFKNQNEVSEPQWYAMLSILGRLPNGYDLSHKYSKDYRNYDPHETDKKLKQAMESSGPRTCDNIDGLWGKCQKCPNFGKQKSPIVLRSESFIRTKDTGFYNITPEGKLGKPNYEDLMRWYEEQHPFVSSEDNGMIYTYNGKAWEPTHRTPIHAFAEHHFNPKPSSMMCREFEQKIKRNNTVPQHFFNKPQMVNFANGTLHLENSSFVDHDKEDGFKYVLPFEYDPAAECPRFDKFMEEVTLNDKDLEMVLLEYMGYSLCAIDPAIGQKGLVLIGEGANGKSVLIDLLKYLAGENNYTAMLMGNELNKLENRSNLDGKLFNVSEEVPSNALSESPVFKTLTAGGEISARKLYSDSYTFKNIAKVIMACNDLPPSRDGSYGFSRRFLIAPFNATFDENNRDVYIREKLYAEAAGIFNRCLKAAKRFMRRGKFHHSDQVEAAVRQYMRDNQPVNDWVNCELIKDPQESLDVETAYKKYAFYAESMGYKRPTLGEFSQALSRNTGSSRTRIKVGNRRKTVINGWAFIEDADIQEDY